jgi:hypothetical protein
METELLLERIAMMVVVLILGIQEFMITTGQLGFRMEVTLMARLLMIIQAGLLV